MDFFDFDNSILDSDMSDLNDISGGEDYNVDDYVLNQSLDSSYNVSFGANKTINGDLYLDTGRTITLEPAGGGLKEKVVDVFVKSGTNTEYILDGNTPRKIDGVTQVWYDGLKYKV